MEKNNKEPVSSGLPEAVIQVFAALVFVGMLIFDKISHLAMPPLSDIYYGTSFVVAVFGKGAGRIFALFRK